MATKKEFTNFANATDLKAAMVSKGIYPAMNTDQDYFDGAANAIHLIHGMFDDGSFKTLNITNNGVGSDFVEPNDPLLVRRWTKREMDVFVIHNISGVSQSDYIFNGTNYVYTIVLNGVTYTGTAANIPNAFAKCLINVINAM